MGSTKSSKKIIIGNVTVKHYLKESLSTILYIIIQEEGSSGKGLSLKFIFLCVHGNLTLLSARNERGRGFCL